MKTNTRTDLDRAVFSTDPRVLARAKTKYEVMGHDEGALKKAVEKLYESALLGRQPEAEWLKEAKILGERVGKPWYDAPERTIVEALAEREGLTPIGFPDTPVPAGATVNLVVQPQVTIKGRRLVLDRVACDDLRVVSLMVGKNYQFASSGPLPGSLFSPDAFPFWLEMDTCQAGQHIALCLVNMSGCLVMASGALLGKVEEGVFR